LRTVAKHHGKLITLPTIREVSENTREGGNLLKLSGAAEAIALKTIGVKLEFNKLKEAPLPLIVHWNKNHFAVVYKITKKEVFISDPAYGEKTARQYHPWRKKMSIVKLPIIHCIVFV
jgi:ATP-binding cassette subfamily B protein